MGGGGVECGSNSPSSRHVRCVVAGQQHDQSSCAWSRERLPNPRAEGRSPADSSSAGGTSVAGCLPGQLRACGSSLSQLARTWSGSCPSGRPAVAGAGAGLSGSHAETPLRGAWNRRAGRHAGVDHGSARKGDDTRDAVPVCSSRLPGDIRSADMAYVPAVGVLTLSVRDLAVAFPMPDDVAGRRGGECLVVGVLAVDGEVGPAGVAVAAVRSAECWTGSAQCESASRTRSTSMTIVPGPPSRA